MRRGSTEASSDQQSNCYSVRLTDSVMAVLPHTSRIRNECNCDLCVLFLLGSSTYARSDSTPDQHSPGRLTPRPAPRDAERPAPCNLPPRPRRPVNGPVHSTATDAHSAATRSGLIPERRSSSHACPRGIVHVIHFKTVDVPSPFALCVWTHGAQMHSTTARRIHLRSSILRQQRRQRPSLHDWPRARPQGCARECPTA